MSEPNFTPGPWHVGHGHELSTGMEGWEYYPVCWSKDDENVCDIVYNKADADLIAAAPEMYAELEEILSDLDTFPQVAPVVDHLEVFDLKQKIRKLLRKASGESEVSE